MSSRALPLLPQHRKPYSLQPRPWEPEPAHILAHPTDLYPRFRLRVFDRCWPWRASRGAAMRDAVLSGNARRDEEDRATYLDACANIQRDPPYRMDQFLLRELRKVAR